MFGKQLVHDMISRSAENEADRRVFLKAAGVAGLGTVGAATIGGGMFDSASAAGETASEKATDAAVLNFALNLEYLEAEFYQIAVFGTGLTDGLTSGKGKKGGVTGGSAVPFKPGGVIGKYAKEIAMDELDHVKFLRKALGSAKVSRPAIDLQSSFATAATAAGIVLPGGAAFNPFADEVSFLLGAFIFEDVGVTAYKGASPLVTNKTYLEAAAGILAVEAYHAGIVRSSLYNLGLQVPAIFDYVDKISGLRDGADGGKNDDQGIGNGNVSNLVPTDKNSIAYSRTAAHVLNVVYLNPASVKKGGFFPKGVNGVINESMGKKKK